MILPRVQPPTFHGMILQTSQPVTDFTLTAHTGERVNLSDFRGKWVVLYFGYTFCPDVCPLTLADLARALRLLEEGKAARVQVLMVSVDPERDTPQRLAAYAPAFHPTFLGLTGSEEELAAAATPLGIYYARQPVEGASGYLVDHTASVTVLDDQGRVRLLWPFGISAEMMAEDLGGLVR
ncbi:MAG: SCO family protein [Caldilineales bacterium]|nr:SCO family protein [Caldilineales bacterium]